MYKDGKKVNNGLEQIKVADELSKPEADVSAADIARLAAEIASLCDPSGVAFGGRLWKVAA